MQHLCARLKVDVAADIHAVALSGERSVFFISHQVILNILCRQFHIIRTARIYPSITAISKSCYVKFSLAAFRHDDIREQHRHETIGRGISLVSRITVTISLLQCRFISTFPVSIVIPVACSVCTAPYQILWYHLHVNREHTETSITYIGSVLSMLLKVNGKRIGISFLGLELEAVFLFRSSVEINIHVVVI